MWTIFKDKLLKLVDKYVPLRCINKPKKKSVWISTKTVRKIKRRNKAWSQYKNSPSTANYDNYKVIRNEVNKMIKNDRANYQQALIRNFKNCPKRFYGYIQSVQTVKNTVCQLNTSDGCCTNSDKEAADTLCHYFQTVFTTEDTTLCQRNWA